MHYNILGVSLAYGTDVDDEYHALVDKYATVRKDFETHMTESCKVSISWPVYSSHHECKYLAYSQILYISPIPFQCDLTSWFSFYGWKFLWCGFLYGQFLHQVRILYVFVYSVFAHISCHRWWHQMLLTSKLHHQS